MKRLAIIVSSIVLVAAAGVITVGVLRMNEPQQGSTATQRDTGTPTLGAKQVLSGLDHPWDVDFLPDDTVIFTERSGDLSKIEDGKKVLIESIADVNAEGEGGLTGLAIDPEFSTNRFVYACFNTTGDVRVVRWALDTEATRLNDRKNIVTGIPTSGSGRHSGCQVAFGPDTNLWVGTGDAADESEPQNQASLGGKILRITRDGQPAGGNPEGPDKRVFSYGHRNIQALAFYDSVRNGSYGISVEHGPSVDDEVNELKPGNFGWDPGIGYDESVPMTDITKFPAAISSVWKSGSPTIAPSGAAFLRGDAWGRLNGWLAVSVLKDQKLLLLNITNGSVGGERTALEGSYGRLRGATLAPDGSLYLTTDNGQDDKLLRVSPE